VTSRISRFLRPYHIRTRDLSQTNHYGTNSVVTFFKLKWTVFQRTRQTSVILTSRFKCEWKETPISACIRKSWQIYTVTKITSRLECELPTPLLKIADVVLNTNASLSESVQSSPKLQSFISYTKLNSELEPMERLAISATSPTRPCGGLVYTRRRSSLKRACCQRTHCEDRVHECWC
jgi:hypothetical protein